MAATLPVLTRTIDDDFTNTWYEIRAEAIDNILDATVLWLALKEFGCLVTQSGGEFITRTVRHAVKSIQNIRKGSALTQTEYKGKTMAMWDWAYFLVDINRSLVDDQKNKGKFRIKSYIADRLEAARDGMVQDMETQLFRFAAYDEDYFNGIWDLCPSNTARTFTSADATSPDEATGSWGGISKTNTWWRVNQSNDNATYDLNLVPKMRSFYNTISNNISPANFIIMNQLLFEAYQDEVADKQQVVRTSFDQKAADLGFQTLTYMGSTMSWTSKLQTGAAYVGEATDYVAFFLNMDWIDIVYDPDVWFDLTGWKDTPNQLERVNYIVSAMQPITSQPRRHGFMDFTS